MLGLDAVALELATHPLAAGDHAPHTLPAPPDERVARLVTDPVGSRKAARSPADQSGRGVAQPVVRQELEADRADPLVVGHAEDRGQRPQRREDGRRELVLEHVDQRDVGLELPHRPPHRRIGEGVGQLERGLGMERLAAVRPVLGRAVAGGADVAGEQPDLVARPTQPFPDRDDVPLGAADPAEPVGDQEDAHVPAFPRAASSAATTASRLRRPSVKVAVRAAPPRTSSMKASRARRYEGSAVGRQVRSTRHSSTAGVGRTGILPDAVAAAALPA